jgi:hypothetical protein
MGQIWAEKSSPIDKTGRAWARGLRDLGKTRPNSPTARPYFGPMAQQPNHILASQARPGLEKCGPIVRLGRAWATEFWVGLFAGPAWKHAQVWLCLIADFFFTIYWLNAACVQRCPLSANSSAQRPQTLVLFSGTGPSQNARERLLPLPSCR